MEQPKNNLKVISEKKNVRMILPNMLTLIGVCIGLTSIRFSFNGQFDLAIIAIIFAALIDGLDGRIARLIKGTSKVGKELDSLTDMISFGVAPAFIMYFWTLSSLGRLGWLICLVYVICVALRLARFNINSNLEPSWRDNFFEGVPSPAGGILVLTPLIISLTDFSYVQLNYNIIVVQIAGLIARRIVCETNNGQTLSQGERIGMIRFGSRADVYYENYDPLVKVGQKTISGETLLAKK